ncbi:MAG: thioredoxin domain-containing protein [Polyangiaceae bacterium]
MARLPALLIIRSATLVALAASAALAVDYRTKDAAFCGAQSGCAALRQTNIAYLWGAGLSLPQAAVLLFALILALSMTRAADWAARLLLPGAVIALGLMAVQAFVLRQFCWLCMTTDLSTLVAGAASLAWLRTPSAQREPAPLKTWAWGSLAAIAALGPTLWPELRPLPPVPSAIGAYYKPSKINVIEFADFECPFCRELHGRLHTLLKRYGDKVHFVRLNMPLERHPFARDAALAAMCSEASGKSDALAEFLFTTEDLSLPTIKRKVGELGIDLTSFDACLAAPTTKARLDREIQALRDAGFQGLPTTYVGGRRIVGAQSDDAFLSALDHAAEGDDIRGIPGWAYLIGIVMLIAVVIRMGGSDGPKSSAPSSDARAP